MDTTLPRKFEFALLVVIIGVLAVVLMNALERVRVEIEEAGVQAEAAAIRIELLERLAHREAIGGKLPESNNPINWIDRPPQPYAGERDTEPKETAVWYFDMQRQELVYRFRSKQEARFYLARGREAAGGLATLSGVALNRVEHNRESVK